MNKAIGGYFELAIDRNNQYHSSCIKLSTARNCLEYILLVRKYTKVYLPYYTCEVLLDPIRKLGLQYEFYSIDKSFRPLIYKDINSYEAIIYTNYFGLKHSLLLELSKKYKTLIVDNAQAFFSLPLLNVDTFYSARKFFGVPDGAYLYINKYLNRNIPNQNTNNITKHLVGRLDSGPENYYDDFVNAENIFMNQDLHQMSILSESILSNINYSEVKDIRRRNFNYLRKAFNEYNMLHIDNLLDNDVPLAYPLVYEVKGLRSYLISQRIYVPQYWECVLNWSESNSYEYYLTNNLYPLTIDQRYDISDMKYIVDTITHYIEKNT